MTDKTLASVIKEAREKIGISQRELSRRTDIDNNTLAKIEKGERKKPNVLALYKLCVSLDLPLDELMELSGYSEHEFEIISNNIFNKEEIDQNSDAFSLTNVITTNMKYDVCARKIITEFLKKKKYKSYDDYKKLNKEEKKEVDKVFEEYLKFYEEDVDKLECTLENFEAMKK